jgi:hypothetical protein
MTMSKFEGVENDTVKTMKILSNRLGSRALPSFRSGEGSCSSDFVLIDIS